MVEMMAQDVQVPLYFVSHWWGDSVVAFHATLRTHAEDREVGTDDDGRLAFPDDPVYWVGLYALSDEDWDVTNPMASAMRRVMMLSTTRGTLSIIDEAGYYFSRVWCLWEIFISLTEAKQEDSERKRPYTYDMYTALPHSWRRPDGTKEERQAIGITDGLIDRDGGRQVNRHFAEMLFPPERLDAAISASLVASNASVEADKNRCLSRHPIPLHLRASSPRHLPAPARACPRPPAPIHAHSRCRRLEGRVRRLPRPHRPPDPCAQAAQCDHRDGAPARRRRGPRRGCARAPHASGVRASRTDDPDEHRAWPALLCHRPRAVLLRRAARPLPQRHLARQVRMGRGEVLGFHVRGRGEVGVRSGRGPWIARAVAATASPLGPGSRRPCPVRMHGRQAQAPGA